MFENKAPDRIEETERELRKLKRGDLLIMHNDDTLYMVLRDGVLPKDQSPSATEDSVGVTTCLQGVYERLYLSFLFRELKQIVTVGDPEWQMWVKRFLRVE